MSPANDRAEHWTEERRFLFDLKGWVCFPSVLTGDEVDACKQHIDRIYDDPDSIDPVFRSRPGLSGPLQDLLDHPVLAEVLSDVIAPDVEDKAHGFRCESNFTYRLRANADRQFVRAHTGTKPAPGPHEYRYVDGGIYSGQTRAVWELNPVGENGGVGTRFLSGSHKRNLAIPAAISDADSPYFETYSCPPGSLLVFCERVLHLGSLWLNDAYPRMSVFNCYNHYNVQVHKMNITHEMVMAMPEKRRTLFRGAWEWWNRGAEGRLNNSYYDEDNRAL
ncbi:hypothetical protein HN371_04955 [Candidatus Poribacteria bacterium]|jgi:hypothetical protein|nr:hypothetical protein [Candidatus Poribacteria bacterium]MBT5532939.1 hypothetical protein [Candidatus Poribacteria bacterium]MBT5711451.1 hypothetical protein [Candidatus Poribacteria bacterium]MBT7098136.1 hypothetical protein [Candidatus Poribacteria bacterium]MBT7805783.1 hypothetical protein [Candidatus Poribacteria bacterium]